MKGVLKNTNSQEFISYIYLNARFKIRRSKKVEFWDRAESTSDRGPTESSELNDSSLVLLD
jgi:hypothetical protein